MNRKEFTKLLEAYGADEGRWPAAVRNDGLRYLAEASDGQQLLAQYRALDDALDRYEVSPDIGRIQSKLLARLPREPGVLDRFITWLLPEDPHYIWKPALAATLPLIIGILVGSNVELPSDSAYDSWEDEIALLALDEPTSESLP